LGKVGAVIYTYSVLMQGFLSVRSKVYVFVVLTTPNVPPVYVTVIVYVVYLAPERVRESEISGKLTVWDASSN